MDNKKHYFNKWVAYGAVLIVFYVLQTTLIDAIAIFEVKPNLIICAVVCIALLENPITGSVFGLAAGFLCDVLGAKFIGPSMLILLLCGFLIGYLGINMLGKNLLNALWLTVALSVVYNILWYLVFYLRHSTGEIFFATIKIILPEAAYTAVFTVGIYFLIRKIHKILQET